MIYHKKPRYFIMAIFCVALVFSSYSFAQEDNREASFLPPSKTLINKNKKEQKKPIDLTKPPEFSSKEVKKEKKKEIVQKKIEIKDKEIISKPVNLGAPVAKAPLADVDPETIGLLSPKQGGLGASLWKDSTRILIDRLMPAINLPTQSYTLNNLARRMFLSTAATPFPSSDYTPKRSLMSQRLEGLMNLGDVNDAWNLFVLADPYLVDPVTLTRLVEASLIGSESQKICEAVSSLMATQSKQKEMQLDWQKILLICQLQNNDKKAVQLSLDMMKEQNIRRDVFLQLLERNVLGNKKRLPRHLTPLKPSVLALLRFSGKALPSYLYKKPAAYLVPELVLSKAQKSKDRILLAERSAAKGILTKKQIVNVYKDVAKEKTKLKKSGAVYRAKLYQASLYEELPQKKINLIKEYLGSLPKSYQTSTLGQISADILETIPVTSDYNSDAVYMARLFALTGRMDKAVKWLNLAKDVAERVKKTKIEINNNWPIFVLAGMISDGEYANGLNDWLHNIFNNNDLHIARNYAGKVLLLLAASGYAVPETAWQKIIEPSSFVKEKMPSPVLIERINQISKSERKGETILLSLLLQSEIAQNQLNVTVDIIRALRRVGLKTDMLSLAREALISLPNMK